MQTSLSDVRQALNQLATDVKTATGGVHRGLQAVGASVGQVDTNAKAVATDFADIAKNAKETSTALKDATKVVDDLKKLHASIVDLLSHELFKG